MTCHTCHSVTDTASTCANSGDTSASALSHLPGFSEQADMSETANLGDQSVDPTLALLTVKEAARRLRIGRTYCYQLIATGELESITVGRLRRVPADAVPEYVARRRKSARSNPAA